MANITKYTDPGGSKANKLWNNETQWHYKGSVSKPLSPKRFDIDSKGLSKVLRKGKSRGS